MAKKLELNDFERAVKKMKRGYAEKRKKKYNLAKELGFTASEAIYLQNRPEEVIRELAEERRLKQLQKGE